MQDARRTRRVGVALVLLSALAWSLNGLYTRALTVDVWTTLAARAACTASLLLAALLVLHGRDAGRLIRVNARIGIWVVLAGAATMLAFIAALFNTTVANVTIIYSLSPLIAAVLARFLIGDRLVARTMVAFSAAVAGVVIMVGSSFGTGRLLGDLFALLMAVGFAVVIVEMRRKPEIDNAASSFLSSLLLAVLLAPVATLSDITLHDAAILFLFGFTSNILGFFLFIAGVRMMPPAEAGLIATIEVVLAPLWVWLLFAEDPGGAALLGGGIVMAAILFHLAGELPARRRAAPALPVASSRVPAD